MSGRSRARSTPRGQNNTRFVSDLAVTNPGDRPAQLTISLVPVARHDAEPGHAGRGRDGRLPEPARPSLGVPGDRGDEGHERSGAPYSGPDVQHGGLRARTAWRCPSSRKTACSPPGEIGRQPLGQPVGGREVRATGPTSPSSSRTRTGGEATGDHLRRRRQPRRHEGLRPGRGQASSSSASSNFAEAVAVGRAPRSQVTRGSAAGYSVVVDNVTGDNSLFTFEELPPAVRTFSSTASHGRTERTARSSGRTGVSTTPRRGCEGDRRVSREPEQQPVARHGNSSYPRGRSSTSSTSSTPSSPCPSARRARSVSRPRLR